MRTVWKFDLEVTDHQTVSVPRGATILHVASQDDGMIQLWAEVDSSAVRERWFFNVVGTGNPTPPAGSYIGTVLTRGGALVWHVYRRAGR